jgi:hypothetical protein
MPPDDAVPFFACEAEHVEEMMMMGEKFVLSFS